MKIASPPKSKRGSIDESNLGHTKDEWGKQEDAPKIHIMEVYDLKWNTDKKKDDEHVKEVRNPQRKQYKTQPGTQVNNKFL